MHIVFRTDASIEMGTGHVVRCLTLAGYLRKNGADCFFICRDLPGNLIELIRQKGFIVRVLPSSKYHQISCIKDSSQREKRLFQNMEWETDVELTRVLLGENKIEWLIVDHYGIDAKWEEKLKPSYRKILVIDDLANRPHRCNLLLDQNYFVKMATRYRKLVNNDCIQLLGPSYVLLRDEFFQEKNQNRFRNGSVKRIFIFFGGSDHTNQTELVISAIQKLNIPEIQIDVVIGKTNPNKLKIQNMCQKTLNMSLFTQVSNMAELMVKADLGVGAGGSAMWERCYLGLPTITAVCATNQFATTQDTAKLGAIQFIGWCSKLSSKDYYESILNMLVAPQVVKTISDKARTVVQNDLGTKNVLVTHILNT